MQALKTLIWIGLLWMFVGSLFAAPANFFLLLVAGTFASIIYLTIGSPEYWGRWAKYLRDPKHSNRKNTKKR
ncbi:MAG: hypothetical protein R3E66_06970 [bacterium]